MDEFWFSVCYGRGQESCPGDQGRTMLYCTGPPTLSCVQVYGLRIVLTAESSSDQNSGAVDGAEEFQGMEHIHSGSPSREGGL